MALAAAWLLPSCSTKKNTAASRNYQAFITRYNIYYNGDTHYKETLASMEKSYEDDFSQLLKPHPANARSDEKAPQPTGDFTRSIEKAQKAIQLRSIKKKPARKPGRNSDPEYKAWLKRDEYNPFLHNAWMLMGRSQFFNGDFLGAASTFFYISKHFTWLPATVTEAKLWQARAYTALGWLFEAETILTRITPASIADSKTLRHLYNITYADFDIRSKDYAGAEQHLREAIASASGPQKYRLNFLLGQVCSLRGDKQAAYRAFDKAAKNNSAPYRLQFNARIKQSEVFDGADITPEVKALRRMTRYDRNKQYLDQIYYAIGNLYLSRRDTADAIENYTLAIDKSTRSGIDKALAQITLAAIYYTQGKYELAQPLYSEAMPQIPDNYPDYNALKLRSDYLDKLAVYSQNVTLQDSLLKLSYMTPEEQTAVAERLIAELKKKEAEAAEQARREELMAEAEANGNPFGDSGNAPSTFTLNSDNSWYFYNPSTVTAGKTDFQRRWGSRKLEDDWRRRNKASFSLSAPDDTAGDEEQDSEGAATAEGEGEEIDLDALERENDPHYVEYYLKQIPKDDAERAVANDVIQEGLYNMGVILKDDLRDFPASRREFNSLLTRYPDNVYRLDVYYNLYLMAAMEDDAAAADRYRRLIIADFPDSPYGRAMTDPAYLDNLRKMDSRQEQLYAAAYEDYLDNDNAAVHAALAAMQQEFPMSKLMPKFMFIDALAYVTENKPDKFREVLTEMLQRYPDTDLAPYASAYIKGLDAGRKLHSGAANMRGMLWDIPLSNDSTAVRDGELQFKLDPESDQMLVLLYPTDQVSANQLLYDIARINFTSFAIRDFDLEQMNFGRLGMLIIKPFANMRELGRYVAVLADNPAVTLPREVRPVIISQADFDLMLETGASFDDYFRYLDEQNYRQAQENVLPESMFGPAETLEDANEAQSDRIAEDLEAPETESPSAPAPPAAPSVPESAADQMPGAPATEYTTTDTPVTETSATEVPDSETPATEAPANPTVETPAETPIQPSSESPANQSAAPVTTNNPVVQPATPAPAPTKPTAPASPQSPAPKPETKPAPKPETKPELPYYPAGGEGEDDPLLDNP